MNAVQLALHLKAREWLVNLGLRIQGLRIQVAPAD